MESYQKQGGEAGTINPRSAKSVHCETCAEGKPDVDVGGRGGRKERAGDRGKGPVQREMPPTVDWQKLRPRKRASLPVCSGREVHHQREKAEGEGLQYSLLLLQPDLVSLKTKHLEQCFKKCI